MSNQRVRVFDGDGETPLGLGTIVDWVTVYAWTNPDGHLMSQQVAEEPPDPMSTKSDEVRTIKNNAKIVLDSGRTVYGCQVWWGPIDT